MFACDSPDLSCMVSIAKMMKVRYLVYGTVGSQRNKYELVLRLLDTKTKKIKKGRLLGDLVSKDSMNKNIDNALRTMFNIKKETLVVASKIRLLTINTNGIIADVFIDDKKVGVTPLTLTSDDIKLGKHVVLIKKEGYEPIKKEVLLSENKIDTIDLKLSTIVIPALKTDVAKKDTTKTDLVKKDIVKKDETLDLTKNTKPIENQKEWYQEWWVWGVAGGVIAATTLTIVLLNIDEATTTSHNVVISF
jgi:hypothetical protein